MAIAVDASTLLLKSRDPGVTPGALIEVDVARAGWEFIGLTVMKLGAGERWSRRDRPGRGGAGTARGPLHGRL